MKQEDLYELFSRPPRARKSVLSVYLNVGQSQRVNLNRGFETQFKEMASSLRKSLVGPLEQDGLAAAVHRVSDFISAYRPEGCGLAVKAVVGLGHTLQAISSDRVWELIYSAGARAPGFECPECSALFSLETSSCAFCNSSVQPVNNVIERAVGHALRNEAKVEVVTGEASAALDSAGGIGAFLKTRTKAVVAG